MGKFTCDVYVDLSLSFSNYTAVKQTNNEKKNSTNNISSTQGFSNLGDAVCPDTLDENIAGC